MVQVLADPATKKRLDQLGIEITPAAQQSPEALRAVQNAEAERWWPVIKAANIKME
jgi:tripartite-type tricarboxylate transporter receptor subunit TctC